MLNRLCNSLLKPGCEVGTLLVNRPVVHDRGCACGKNCDGKTTGFC